MQTRQTAESGVGEPATAVGEEDVAEAEDEVRGDDRAYSVGAVSACSST